MIPILKALGMVVASLALISGVWAIMVYVPETIVFTILYTIAIVSLFIYFYKEFKK